MSTPEAPSYVFFSGPASGRREGLGELHPGPHAVTKGPLAGQLAATETKCEGKQKSNAPDCER
jgi:hypothetical protein